MHASLAVECIPSPIQHFFAFTIYSQVWMLMCKSLSFCVCNPQFLLFTSKYFPLKEFFLVWQPSKNPKCISTQYASLHVKLLQKSSQLFCYCCLTFAPIISKCPVNSCPWKLKLIFLIFFILSNILNDYQYKLDSRISPWRNRIPLTSTGACSETFGCFCLQIPWGLPREA